MRRCSFQSVTKCDSDICKNLQVNVEFPGGITIDFLTMARTISMPQIGGLVQRREVTSVGLESRLDNDGLIVGSVSPRPTYFERCSFDDRLLDEALSTDHCTRGTLVRGGVSLQPVDTCSPQDLQREKTVRFSLQVVVGGAISAWIAVMASVDSQKFLVSEVVFWFDVAHLPLTSSSSTSSWLITLMFFRTVNKHFPLVYVYKILKNPVWCGLHVECAKTAETVMRDHQPLLWVEEDAFDGPSFTLQVNRNSVFPDATLKSELMALVKTQVRALDFKRNQRW